MSHISDVRTADYHTHLKQYDASNCGLHVCLLAEALLLRKGGEMRTDLRGIDPLAERRRIFSLLRVVREGGDPNYHPPGWSLNVSG